MNAEEIKTIPYQKCPLCAGHGRILADGMISSVYQECPSCKGHRIIPEFMPETLNSKYDINGKDFKKFIEIFHKEYSGKGWTINNFFKALENWRKPKE